MNRICILGCLLGVWACAADVPTANLLKLVEQRYNRADSLQALFTDQYTKAGHTPRTEHGVLNLRKPGRMRWEYEDPKGKLVVCDGKTMWVYTPSDNQVEKTSLKQTDEVSAPIAFLLGKLHFDKEFRDIKATPQGSDTLITALPKTDSMPYNAVAFLVTADGRIKNVKVTRYDNSVMDYTFEQEKLNPKLDDKLFHFVPPRGAEVVEAEKD